MNYSIVLRRRVTLAAFSLALLSPAFGQTPGTGAIRGRVLDPAGLPVANAHVLLTNESTKTSRTDDTTSEGSFAASLLAPGDYSITVEQPGLEEKGTHTVLVTVGETGFLSITLAVAHVGVNIEVDANAELMQTQSATLGRSVDNRAIQSLPLANRNFTQLLSLSPGVIVALPDATTLGRNTQNVAAVGNKTTANSFQFNGIDANNLAQNSATVSYTHLDNADIDRNSFTESRPLYRRGAGKRPPAGVSRSGALNSGWRIKRRHG